MDYLIQRKIDDINAVEGENTIAVVDDGYGTATVYVKGTLIAAGANAIMVNVAVTAAWAMMRR